MRHESTARATRDAVHDRPWALIGAGPMGLVMARNLQRFDLPFQGFEMHTEVGGLWDIDGPRSTMYESAHLISSKRMTEVTEFPMADHVADYPSHREVGRYFRDFADRFELRPNYRFGTEVTRVSRRSDAEGGGFEIRSRPAPASRSSPGTGGEDRAAEDGSEETVELYRGLLIANGTLSEPNIPRLEGSFEGELLHSCRYRTPEIFDGKRVLVVGAGNSGCDIAVDAAHRAAKVALSVRRGYHFVPKYVFGRPADSVGGKIRLPRFLKQRLDRL
ncbi:MAG: NAD(P)/FAD-dependent oxidoreductase, partial [Holophagales bacterium]|nr:NAD(P)/FAD-dependent oxidoreductase [Holophagales bacterium]